LAETVLLVVVVVVVVVVSIPHNLHDRLFGLFQLRMLMKIGQLGGLLKNGVLNFLSIFELWKD
jgi:hypothetical protein